MDNSSSTYLEMNRPRVRPRRPFFTPPGPHPALFSVMEGVLDYTL